jgi:hypothetical protein
MLIIVLLLFAKLSFALDCSQLFLQVPEQLKRPLLLELNPIVSKEFSKKIQKQFKELHLYEQKLKLAEKTNNQLFRAYQEDIKLLKDELAKYSDKIPEQELLQIQNSGIKQIDEKYIELTNILTENIYSIARTKKVPVTIIETETRQGAKYKSLLLTEGQTSLESIKKIQRYQERFGTEIVSFDFFENMQIGSQGFSLEAKKRIDLGLNGIKRIIESDMITMVGKHEFTHAAYVAARDKKLPSIFNHNYYASKTKPLGGKSYSEFMSAEELYTFANNMTWASERLAQMNKYAAKEIIEDMQEIAAYMRMHLDVSTQSFHLSREFGDEFATIITQLEKNQKDLPFFDFLNSNYRTASVNDLNMVAFVDKDGRLITFFIDNSKAPVTEKLLKAREKTIKEFNKRIKGINKEDKELIEKVTSELLEKEMQSTTKEHLELLTMLNDDLAAFHKVSESVIQEGAILNEKTQRFFTEFQKEYKKVGDKILQDSFWNRRIKEILGDYRSLGNSVKENFKGFAH